VPQAKRLNLKLVIAGLAVLVLLIVAVPQILRRLNTVSTDDAYVTPSEEEQYQMYRTTAEHLKQREVVIRVLDKWKVREQFVAANKRTTRHEDPLRSVEFGRAGLQCHGEPFFRLGNAYLNLERLIECHSHKNSPFMRLV
jgi:hypothetical protein